MSLRVIAKCVHHRPRPGTLQTCALGVEPRSVFRGGIGPCITFADRPDRRSACSKYELVPQAQLDAEEREIEQAMERFSRNQCPECGADLTSHDRGDAIVWICSTHGGVARGCKRITEAG